jgi:hypothetical protein
MTTTAQEASQVYGNSTSPEGGGFWILPNQSATSSGVTFYGSGTGSETVYLGTGTATVTLGTGSNTVYGAFSATDTALSGAAANTTETITGTTGNDRFYVEANGTYTVNLGAGDNTYGFVGSHLGATTITESSSAMDTLDLSGFTGSFTAGGATDFINLTTKGSASATTAFVTADSSAGTITLAKGSSTSAVIDAVDLGSGSYGTAFSALTLGGTLAATTLATTHPEGLLLNNAFNTVTLGTGAEYIEGGGIIGDTVTGVTALGTTATLGGFTASSISADYVVHNYSGASTTAAADHIQLGAGTNNLDLSATTTSDNVSFSATGFTATVASTTSGGLQTITGADTVVGTGTVTGHTGTSYTITTGSLSAVEGGSGANTFSFAANSGTHVVDGGTGSTSSLVYTGNVGVTLDARDHTMINGGVDVSFTNMSSYNLLGNGNNTFIGDGTATTVSFGHGNNVADANGGACNFHNNSGGTLDVQMEANYGAIDVSNAGTGGMIIADFSNDTNAAASSMILGTSNEGASIGDTGNTTHLVADNLGTDELTGVVLNNLASSTITEYGHASGTTPGTNVDDSACSIVGSGQGDTIYLNDGNNYVLTNGAASGTATVDIGGTDETGGIGSNVIDLSGGGTQNVNLGVSGTNLAAAATYETIQGFNPWDATFKDTISIAGTADLTAHVDGTSGASAIINNNVLDLSNYAVSQATFFDSGTVNGVVLSGSNATAGTSLMIELGDSSHYVVISNYFDGAATNTTSANTGGTGTHMGAGTGEIDSIEFSGGSLNFAAVVTAGQAQASAAHFA